MKKSSTWINESIEKEIMRRNRLFQKWIDAWNCMYVMQEQSYGIVQETEERSQNRSNGQNSHLYANLSVNQINEISAFNTNNPAEPLDHFFTSIDEGLSNSLSGKNQATKSFRYTNAMVLQKPDCVEVRSVFNKMRNKKSNGHEGICDEV